MSRLSLSTQQVADAIGVPYSTLLKWASVDQLLKPVLGGGGRRGGDRWSQPETLLAGLVARLRLAALPLPTIRAVLRAIRACPGPKADVAVYVSVCVRPRPNDAERRVALLRVDPDGELREASQLSLF